MITIGTLDGTSEVWSIRVPGVLSFMATESFDGTVEGINDVQAQFEEKYGPGDYRPNIPVTYWMFRLMMGAGFIMILVSIVGLWLTRKGRLPEVQVGLATGDDLHRRTGRRPTPPAGSSPRWAASPGRWSACTGPPDSVSPSVSGGAVLTSLIVFTVLYGVLAVIEVGLMVKYVKIGPPTEEEALASIQRRLPPGGGAGTGPSSKTDADEKPLAFAY